MRKTYDELTITDDFLFCKVMSDEKLCSELIEILLDIQVDHVKTISSQFSIFPDYEKHSIRLDVYVKDSDKIYDIEMQTTDRYNLEKRCRYYQSLIDIDQLEHQMDYKKLKESYIIFICTFDPFKKGELKYEVCQILNRRLDYSYDDKTNKVFYNVTAVDKTKASPRLKNFLNYLKTKKPCDDFTKKVDSAVYTAKTNSSWRKEYMTVGLWIEEAKEQARKEGLEEGRTEGLAEGLAEGRTKGLAEGLAEGRTKGLAEGLAEGRAQGEAAASLEKALIAVKELNASPELVAEKFNVPLEKIKEALGNN